MVATQIFFMFIPIWGFMIQFDEHIFQMGWFNHQLVMVCVAFIKPRFGGGKLECHNVTVHFYIIIIIGFLRGGGDSPKVP